MKSTTLLLIGGLAIAGTALASDPTPQSAPTGTALKVGIDAKGNLRPLTAEESAALDAKAVADGGNTVMARGARTAAKSASALPQLPATIEESMANQRIVKGIVSFQPTQDMMSSIAVTKNADGTLTYAENGEPMHQVQKQEAASE